MDNISDLCKRGPKNSVELHFRIVSIRFRIIMMQYWNERMRPISNPTGYVLFTFFFFGKPWNLDTPSANTTCGFLGLKVTSDWVNISCHRRVCQKKSLHLSSGCIRAPEAEFVIIESYHLSSPRGAVFVKATSFTVNFQHHHWHDYAGSQYSPVTIMALMCDQTGDCLKFFSISRATV